MRAMILMSDASGLAFCALISRNARTTRSSLHKKPYNSSTMSSTACPRAWASIYFIAGMVPPETDARIVTQSSSVLPSSRRMLFKNESAPRSKVAARYPPPENDKPMLSLFSIINHYNGLWGVTKLRPRSDRR